MQLAISMSSVTDRLPFSSALVLQGLEERKLDQKLRGAPGWVNKAGYLHV